MTSKRRTKNRPKRSILKPYLLQSSLCHHAAYAPGSTLASTSGTFSTLRRLSSRMPSLTLPHPDGTLHDLAAHVRLAARHARRCHPAANTTLLLCGHQIGVHALALHAHLLELGRPVAQVVLGVVEHLARLRRVLEGRARVAGDDGRVVEQVQQAPAVARQDGLLLGPLDDGGEVDVVGFLDLLACLGKGVSSEPRVLSVAWAWLVGPTRGR